jgi:hypothetical protein
VAAVSTVTTDAVAAPLREFLVWVARCPRTYSDAMEAWRSSCPRFTVWEDALAADLIQVLPGTRAAADAQVILTQRGQLTLASHKP